MTLYPATRQVLTGGRQKPSSRLGKTEKRILVSRVSPHSYKLESGVKYLHSDSVDFVSSLFMAWKEPQLIPDQPEIANNGSCHRRVPAVDKVILCVKIYCCLETQDWLYQIYSEEIYLFSSKTTRKSSKSKNWSKIT